MTRRWIAADYPSKRHLTRSEAMDVLRHGPDPKWFEPWAEHGVVLPGVTERKFRYGYVHMSGGTNDVRMFLDREGLSWGLEALHKEHSKCDECQGLFYFGPDEPLRLRMVIEADDSDDEEADQ